MKLFDKNFYKTNINEMRLKLAKLLKSNKKTWKIRANCLKNDYKKVNKVLYYQKLPFVFKII